MAKRVSTRKPPASKPSRQWRRMDLHIHTPASSDYQESGTTYLDILRQAEMRGLDIIAITDHNTVAGFRAMKREIEKLLWLEELNRMEPDEKRRLDEYRRLLGKILVLPGFEFTATFGFHILGIFPPETPVSILEHLLLQLNIPADLLRKGSSTVGATADVLTVYRIINEAGGIVIAAHVNSGNGVMMLGLDFGGQTRIAYTQDPNLHVLEVTDLEKRGTHTTRRFFDGSKPEYPRPMRCIQGSDAHRLTRESPQSKNLGIADRVTEILLDEVSFGSVATVLKGNDLSLTRPYRGPANPVDFVQVAREEGPSLVQAFHGSLTQRGGHFDQILKDICAMSNTNGGTIYIGASANPTEKPEGVKEAEKAIERLNSAVISQITPTPVFHIDTLSSQKQQIIRVVVQPGPDIPYAIEQNQFYVRDETDTSLAVRDEIVQLVLRRVNQETREPLALPVPTPNLPTKPPSSVSNRPAPPEKKVQLPRTGVEVVYSEKRNGTFYHTVRDLRNDNLIQNVTRSSARKLWHYAIAQVEASPPKLDKIKWQGNKALLNQRTKDDNTWYDLALRENDTVRIFYGVTDSGLNEDWLGLVGETSN